MSKKKIVLLLVFANFLVGCHQTSSKHESAIKYKNQTEETQYEADSKQENSTSVNDTFENNEIKNDGNNSKNDEIIIIKKSATNQKQNTQANKTETKETSQENKVFQATGSKASENQNGNSNVEQPNVSKENVSDKNAGNVSQEKPKEDTSPSQKYYFAKCDCGYMIESHESVDDAISKLFAAGHGNSYEHSGYVAGGDLD